MKETEFTYLMEPFEPEHFRIYPVIAGVGGNFPKTY